MCWAQYPLPPRSVLGLLGPPYADNRRFDERGSGTAQVFDNEKDWQVFALHHVESEKSPAYRCEGVSHDTRHMADLRKAVLVGWKKIAPMKQFISFLLVGGLAASLNWSSRFLFSIWFNFEVAIVLAFVVGLTTGFVLMRGFVFEGREKSVAPQVSMYVLINGLGLLQTLGVSIVLARWILPGLGLSTNSEGIAHLFGVLVPVITSYFGHRKFTFK
jgi:putative flippase GtrA